MSGDDTDVGRRYRFPEVRAGSTAQPRRRQRHHRRVQRVAHPQREPVSQQQRVKARPGKSGPQERSPETRKPESGPETRYPEKPCPETRSPRKWSPETRTPKSPAPKRVARKQRKFPHTRQDLPHTFEAWTRTASLSPRPVGTSRAFRSAATGAPTPHNTSDVPRVSKRSHGRGNSPRPVKMSRVLRSAATGGANFPRSVGIVTCTSTRSPGGAHSPHHVRCPVHLEA
jgi:hypothetical protein